MVSLAKSSCPAKRRVTVHIDEAKAFAAALVIVMNKMPPPECVGESLASLCDRILDAFDMDIEVCGECGDISVGGTVMLANPEGGE